MDYGDKLKIKKQAIEDEIHRIQDYIQIPIGNSFNELSMYDPYLADNASERYHREKNAGMLELYQIELEKTNEALARYYQGKYKTCEICGKEIEEERLQRLVNTTLCAQCARYVKPVIFRPDDEDLNSVVDRAEAGETLTVDNHELLDN